MIHFAPALLFCTLFVPGIYAHLSPDEANARCAERDKCKPIAVWNEDIKNWDSCIPSPPDITRPPACFGSSYMDPKDGVERCCLTGSFSYDPVSKEGKCCPTGQVFSWDAVTKTGGCCADAGKFQCSCVAPIPVPAPTCPTGGGQVYATGGKRYKLYCFSTTLSGQNFDISAGTNPADCARRCAANPKCRAAAFNIVDNSCNLKAAIGTIEKNENVHLFVEVE